MTAGTSRTAVRRAATGALACLLAAAAAVVAAPAFSRGVPDSLVTRFERSCGTETPRYDETVACCRRLAAASPRLTYTTFGTSPQGRALPLLIADRDGLTTPEQVRAAGRAVVLIQAAIHAGEPDGKDAGLLLLRDLAVTRRLQALLDGVTVLFIPIFNVDGHERFGPYNRINQNGPSEAGWRTTAGGLNLNRDFVKADTAEMRAWLRLFAAWLPDFLFDCHVTDGADYQYVLTYGLERFANLDPGLVAWETDAFLAPLQRAMTARGLPLAPYVEFRDWHDPRSGLEAMQTPPYLSTGYAAVQNRPSLLIETHMLKDYRTRVEATRALLEEGLAVVGRERARLRRLVAAADSAVAAPAFRAAPFPLEFKAGSDSVMIDFLGVAYDAVTSDLTGGPWVRYDSRRPRVWRLPWFGDVRPSVTAELPAAYIIPPEWDEITSRLALHGVVVRRLDRALTLPVESYRFHDVKWKEKPYEGRHRLEYALDKFAETRAFPAGSAVIDLGQRAARLIAHALEPAGPAAFVRWGFFDPIFEQKEYVEAYVMEAKAREMLVADPALRAEFAARKAADPAFAQDQEAMLNWFFQRTPWWDPRLGVYPVGRVMDAAVAAGLGGDGRGDARSSARGEAGVLWPPWLRSKPKPVVYPEIVVTPAWLGERLSQPDVRLLDVRARSAAAAGRLSGALLFAGGPGVGPLLPADLRPGEAGARFAALGLRPDDLIVCYGDSASLSEVARLFWLLECAGARTVRVLDGGFAAWRRAGLPIESAAPRRERPAPAAWDAAADTSRWLDAAGLASRFGRPGYEILDARGRGYGDTPTALEAFSCPWHEGHVPHALPFDFAAQVEGASLRPADFVRAAIARTGPRPSTPVDGEAEFVVYGEEGPADAALGYLLLRLAGFRALVFPGGWREWAADPARPFVRVVTADELSRRLGPAASDSAAAAAARPSRRFALIDVRHDLDWAAERIPGAVNVMAHQLDDSLAVVMARVWPGLAAATPVVAYCYGPDCIRSRNATTLLARLGWQRPEWFRGGMRDWKAMGGTVVRAPSRP